MSTMEFQVLVDRCNRLEGELARLQAEVRLKAGVPDKPRDRRIASIIESASLLFSVSSTQIVGESRAKQHTRARGAVAWVASQTTGDSLGRIGRQLGNRDYNTVRNMVRRVDQWRGEDQDYRSKTNTLRDWFTPVAEREEVDHAGHC